MPTSGTRTCGQKNVARSSTSSRAFHSLSMTSPLVILYGLTTRYRTGFSHALQPSLVLLIRLRVRLSEFTVNEDRAKSLISEIERLDGIRECPLPVLSQSTSLGCLTYGGSSISSRTSHSDENGQTASNSKVADPSKLYKVDSKVAFSATSRLSCR
jgi:hypothetical protein